MKNNGYFQTCYNYENKGAKYVAYTIDGSNVNVKNIEKRPRFYDDLNIPKKIEVHTVIILTILLKPIVDIYIQMPRQIGVKRALMLFMS